MFLNRIFEKGTSILAVEVVAFVFCCGRFY